MANVRRPSHIPVRGSLVLALTIGGLALLMGFRAPESTTDLALAVEPTVDPETTVPGAAGASSSAGSSPSASLSAVIEPSPWASASPSAEPTTAVVRTATGSAYRFRFGVVQVAVTVEGDDIVDIEAIQLPEGDRRSLAISEEVEPMLRESALVADSADIDVVSGATYTSRAYAYSLQSALDQLAAG